ncbi:MAG: hypothetical protein M0R22_02860 [Dehalococcoidia bacterium]|jgi:hypothetical protein|nr:hypothetical protein [Dehalococcoidia bacterium]
MVRLFRGAAAGRALLAAGVLLVSTGCSAPAGEGFAIYLTKYDTPPSQMDVLSHVDLADEPVISADDILSYNAATHEMLLTEEAMSRLAELQVPVQGRSFLVCVDRAPVYWGAFWVLYSSQSFDGITIWKPLGVRDSAVVAIGLGYPGSSFYQGEDPRDDPLVMAALERAGKLFVPPPEESPLPRSMKGYELYSWQDGGEWRFALMTGTNRNKTAEEVLSPESGVSSDGWVHLNVVGVDAVKAALSRVPEGEYVSWLADPRDAQSGAAFGLPPESMVDAIEEQARQSGLNFYAPAR